MVTTKNEPAPGNLLARQVKGMLAFWREATEELNNDTIVMLEAERENLLRAIQVGLSFPQMWGDTAEILSQAFPFTEQRGYWQEWIPLLERCLENSKGWSPTVRIFLMNRLGQGYRLNRQLEKAIVIHLEAEQIAQAAGQNELIARVQHDLLEDYLFLGEYSKALAIGQSAINLFETTGEPQRLLANCYKMLGLAFHETADSERAEGHLRTAVQLWRSLNDELYLARALSDLARPLVTLKKYNEAQDCLIEAASILASTIYDLDKCMVQINLGSVHAARQNWPEAEAAFRRANSPYLRQSVNLLRKARVNNNLGYVLFQQGRYEIAEEYLRQAVGLWEQAQDELQAANTLSTLADCLAARNQIEAALPLYEQVIDTLRKYPQNAFAQSLLSRYEKIPEEVRKQK